MPARAPAIDPRPQRGRWGRVLLVLLAAHLCWGLARLPTKVWGKRLAQVADYRERGPAAFHLDNEHRGGAAIVARIVAETPPDCAVLWRGAWRGALEFVPALIAPRLLVDETQVAAGATAAAGRPLARGAGGVLVVVGRDSAVELVTR